MLRKVITLIFVLLAITNTSYAKVRDYNATKYFFDTHPLLPVDEAVFEQEMNKFIETRAYFIFDYFNCLGLKPIYPKGYNPLETDKQEIRLYQQIGKGWLMEPRSKPFIKQLIQLKQTRAKVEFNAMLQALSQNGYITENELKWDWNNKITEDEIIEFNRRLIGE